MALLEDAIAERDRRDLLSRAVAERDRRAGVAESGASRSEILSRQFPEIDREGQELTSDDFVAQPEPPKVVRPGPAREFQGAADEFIRALGRGTLNVGSGLLSSFADVAVDSLFDVEKIEALADTAREAAQKPKFQPGTDGGVKGFIVNAVGDALPFMAATIGATLVGGPTAGFGVAYSVEGKNAYFDALDGGASQAQAEMEGMIVGSINAALELLQINRVMRFAKIGKASVKAVAKEGKKNAIKNIVKLGKNLTKETVKLAITEGLQEAAQETTSVLAPLTTGRELQKEGKLKRIGQAGLGGAVAGVVLGGAGRITQAAISQEVAQQPDAAVEVEALRVGLQQEPFAGVLEAAAEAGRTEAVAPTKAEPTVTAPKPPEAVGAKVEGKGKRTLFHGGPVEKGKLPTVEKADLTDIRGVFFTEDAETAKFFGEREGREGIVQKFEVDLQNPASGEIADQIEAELRAEGVKEPQIFDAVTDELLDRGFDSVIRESGTGPEIIVLKDEAIAQPPTEAKPAEAAKPPKLVDKPAKEIVIAKPSEIPKAPPDPITEKPLIPLKGKEAQVFMEDVRTQEKITEAEAGEVGIEPAGASFTDHIETFQSYQLPKTSRIPAMTKQMRRINGLRLSGKVTAQVANKRIHKLRSLLVQQAVKEKIALRVDKKGKVKIALRESGIFVPKEVATYMKFNNIEPMLGGGQDITRAIQQMDGSLTIKEKLQTKGQAGPIERFVLWRTRTMTLQKLNWLKEKTIEIRQILSAKKGSESDKNINRILEQIGKADRGLSIESIIGKKPSSSKGDIKAAVELRQFYDDLIEEQNAARLMRGQDEIPYRQNYSPQIIRDTTVWEQLFLRDKGVGILEGKDLPDYIKPNAPFNPRAQAREADVPYDKRVLSARELAESYIITASKDIFNTSIIQNNKAFIDQLKGQGLEKTAGYLAEWTATSYAGIKPRLDRAIKLPKWAQGGLRYFNRLRNLAVFPLNVAWSLSTQPLSLSNTIGRYGLPNTVRGFAQWLQPSIRKQAAQDYFSFIVKSSRRGGVTKQDASNLLGENIKTQKTVGEFIENFTTILLTEMEKLLTGTSIRAAHITGAKRGLRGEALKQFASDGGAKTQSMYNDEDKPMILRSLLVKSGAPYQTYAFEVANTFREWAGRTGTPPDSKLYAMWSITRWLAALTVLKMMANFVRGKEWSWWDLIPIPFREFWLTPIVSKLTGEFVPGSAGLPSPVDTSARIAKGINDVLETGNWRKLRNEMTKYGPGVFGIPGGVQWTRTVDAIIIYASGELTDRRGRVMFEMKNPEDLARAIFTGVWTTKEARKVLEKRQGKKPEKKKKPSGFTR